LVVERVGDGRNRFDRIDLGVDVDRRREIDDQALAVVGKAAVEALVAGDLGAVQCGDLRAELIVFRIDGALIDADLQVEIGRLDRAESILAGVCKLAPLVSE
jgi:hypothetical protein